MSSVETYLSCVERRAGEPVGASYIPPSFGNTALAKLRTKQKPHMSVTVVSSGPETRVGSRLNLFKTRGSIPPRLTETNVLPAKAPPTTRPSHGFSR